MTLNFDSKTMHRAIGAGVWVALLLIVMPGMMDRAARLSKSAPIAVTHLPKKPVLPAIAVNEERQVFESKPIASVDLGEPPSITPPEPVIKKTVATQLPPKPEPRVKEVKPSAPARAIEKPPVALKRPTPAPKTGRYVVQLGSFSKQENATALVQKLNKAGFRVSSQRIMVRQTPMYKVSVGGIQTKDEAIRLQKRLADVTHINGMIIQSGVS